MQSIDMEALNVHNIMKPETKEKILDYIAWGITIAAAVAFLWAISNTFDNLFN